MSFRLSRLPRLRATLSGCIALLAAGAMAPASANDDPGRMVTGPVAATVTKVRDGDTLEVEAFVWPQQVVRTAVRLRGIDAPEVKGRCASERDVAETARRRLEALVGGRTVRLSDIAGDKYFGRVLARVAGEDGVDIGGRLLGEGLVAPYRGGKRRDWCVGEAKLSGFRPADREF